MLQLGVDLVDDRAGPAGALVVHRRDLLLASALRVVLEDDDLGVLPAELDHGVHLGVELLDGERDGRHFLHELGADERRQRGATRTGHEDAAVAGADADFRFEPPQELERLLGLLGLVALVVRPDDLVPFGLDGHGLDRRRANVDADEILAHGHATSYVIPRSESQPIARRAHSAGRHGGSPLDSCRPAIRSLDVQDEVRRRAGDTLPVRHLVEGTT